MKRLTGEGGKTIRFAAVAAAVSLAAVIVFALLTRLEVFGAGFAINFALILGVVGTIALGVGLMALVFYSDRAGADDAVKHSDQVSRDLTPDA